MATALVTPAFSFNQELEYVNLDPVRKWLVKRPYIRIGTPPRHSFA
jgi:hypothetical protein